MNLYQKKSLNDKSQAAAEHNGSSHTAVQLQDNRPVSVLQKKLNEGASHTPTIFLPVQRKPNNTGLPDNLKSGIENLSGYSMDDVKVHYNSSQPAQLSAHAYAQGTDIHVASGQEKHLPHEAWHVVQQKQGRVKPALQMKGKVNDEKGLEKEADVMGAKVVQTTVHNRINPYHYYPSVNVNSAPVQLMPDKKILYLERLKKVAYAARPEILSETERLATYITSLPNRAHVGTHVAMRVRRAIADAGGVIHITQLILESAIEEGLAENQAEPGQYPADTAHNAELIKFLNENNFIQRVMNHALHNEVSGRRNELPIAGAIPAFPQGTDDRVLEASDLFNRLTNLTPALPQVSINPSLRPDAAMGDDGVMDLGWAAARGTIVHEFGHHLENNLSPASFVTLHNFLSARSRTEEMRNVGYFFGRHPGYDIDMPKINAGGLAGRRTPQNFPQRVKNALITTPFKTIEQGIGRIYHASPMRYAGLTFSGLKQQGGKLVSFMSERREPRNWGNKGVENFFVHNANNRQLSYNSVVYDNDSGGTEYLSTTVEFFNRPSHVRELVRKDPLRVALFLYLANRTQYELVRTAFNATNSPHDLDNLIHTISIR